MIYSRCWTISTKMMVVIVDKYKEMYRLLKCYFLRKKKRVALNNISPPVTRIRVIKSIVVFCQPSSLREQTLRVYERSSRHSSQSFAPQRPLRAGSQSTVSRPSDSSYFPNSSAFLYLNPSSVISAAVFLKPKAKHIINPC